MKKFIEKIKNKTEKRGSAIIEAVLVFPLIIILIFLMLQLFLYYYSNNVMNTATNDAANTVSYQLRGNPLLVQTFQENYDESDVSIIGFDEGGPLSSLKESVEEVIHERVKEVTKANTFILFDEGEHLFISNEEACNNALASKETGNARVVCAYLYIDRGENQDNRASSYQIVVRTKVPFRFVGNVFGWLSGGDVEGDSKFSVYGNSSSPIEMPGRFNYN